MANNLKSSNPMSCEDPLTEEAVRHLEEGFFTHALPPPVVVWHAANLALQDGPGTRTYGRCMVLLILAERAGRATDAVVRA